MAATGRAGAGDSGEFDMLGTRVGVTVKQRTRVGMCRVGHHPRRGLVLDDPPGIHDQHPVGRVQDQAEVVADQHGGEADLALQVLDRLDNRLLHQDIKRGGGLIEDDQPRVEGERQADGDALPHAAGELVRVTAQRRFRQLDPVEQFDRAPPHVGPARAPLGAQHVAEVVLDRPHRVEGVHAALQHERESVTAHPAQPFTGQRGDVGPVEDHSPGIQPRWWAQHAGDRVAEGRLAAAGFADQADELAIVEG